MKYLLQRKYVEKVRCQVINFQKLFLINLFIHGKDYFPTLVLFRFQNFEFYLETSKYVLYKNKKSFQFINKIITTNIILFIFNQHKIVFFLLNVAS